MHDFHTFLALFLLLSVAASAMRIYRGPTAADRILAAQVLGTTAVAVLLLLAQESDSNSLRDVSLVLALLAAVMAVAFVQRAWPSAESYRDND